MSRRPILVVTPSFRGGSWRRTEEAIRRASSGSSASGQETKNLVCHCVGYGPWSTTDTSEEVLPAPHRVIRIPFGEYSRWHFLVQMPILSAFTSLPLACVSYVWGFYLRPRAVFANGLVAAFWLLPLVWILRARLLVAHHGWVADVKGPAAWLTRRLGRHLEKVFVNSRGSADDLSRLVPRDRLVILEHNPAPAFFVEREPFEQWETFDLSARPTLLFVSRLDPEKNVDLLIPVLESMLQSKDSGEDRPLFLIGGDGEMKADVQALTERFPEDVVYLGYIESQETLARLYRTADLFWGCGTATYLELPAVEALVAGTPILIPDRTSILGARRHGQNRVDPDLVPEAQGRLVKADTADLGQALIEMLHKVKHGDYNRDEIRDEACRRYGLHNLEPMLDALRAL